MMEKGSAVMIDAGTEASLVVHKATETMFKLEDIGFNDIDDSWTFTDNDDDYKVALTNGKHLKVSLFALAQGLDYYTKFEELVAKAYGDFEWKKYFWGGHGNCAQKKEEAKAEFASKKEELMESAKAAGVDLSTHNKKERIR